MAVTALKSKTYTNTTLASIVLLTFLEQVFFSIKEVLDGMVHIFTEPEKEPHKNNIHNNMTTVTKENYYSSDNVSNSTLPVNNNNNNSNNNIQLPYTIHNLNTTLDGNKISFEQFLKPNSWEQVLLILRARHGIQTKTRWFHLRPYTKCFSGNEFIRWLVHSVPQTSNSCQKAATIAQSLLDAGLLSHVAGNGKYAVLHDNHTNLYRCSQDEKTSALNTFIKEKNPTNLQSQQQVSVTMQLRHILLCLHAEHIDDHGMVDYKTMAISSEFAQFACLSNDLRYIDLDALLRSDRRNERLAFWINVYNVLVIHGLVVSGIPSNIWSRLTFFSHTRYNIGGYLFSLNDIEHGILRANTAGPGMLKTPFSKKDPRVRFAFNSIDPRIHFALNCGAKGCPPVRVYSAEHIDRELDRAAAAFCTTEVSIADHPSSSLSDTTIPDENNQHGNHPVQLSQIFKWYYKDFGCCDADVVRFVLQYTRDQTVQQHLRDIIDSRQSISITFTTYDWTLNHQ